MDDLAKDIDKRKHRSPAFDKGFESGYEQFKIGKRLKLQIAGA